LSLNIQFDLMLMCEDLFKKITALTNQSLECRLEREER